MKVLIADDNAVVRRGLVALLKDVCDIDDVTEVGDGRAAVEAASGPQGPFDMAFLDYRMPVMDGLEALGQMGEVPCVMLTNCDDGKVVREAIDHGAKGFLVYGEYTETELAAAVNICVHGGTMMSARASDALTTVKPGPRFGLSRREIEVMEALAQGLTNVQIAHRLFLSDKTVKNHLSRIFQKMAVSSRSEAIIAWMSS